DNTGVLKHHFVNGLLPNIQKAVKLTCIGWEAQNLEVVMQHAKHAEQNDEKRNTEKQQKLENAQYMFYQSQSQSNNQMPRDDNYQEARRGRGRGRGRWNAQNGRIGDRDRCRICGQRGHWARECPENPNNFPQQQQYQNNFRQQPQQSYPQQRQNYREQQHTSSFPPPPPTASSTA
ncbi:MAG: C2HC-type zinc finger protein, partial [Cetobacterium sp.]